MDVPLAVLADYANTTADGKLNILGVFGAIRSEQFPARHSQFAVVLRFHAGPAERGQKKTLEIRFMDADGKTLFAIGSEVVVPEGPGLNANIDVILMVRDLVIPSAGSYGFHILVNGDEKGRIGFEATLLRPKE